MVLNRSTSLRISGHHNADNVRSPTDLEGKKSTGELPLVTSHGIFIVNDP